MGYDAGCDESPTGSHQWLLTDVAIGMRGSDTISECMFCGLPQYEPGPSPSRSSTRRSI